MSAESTKDPRGKRGFDFLTFVPNRMRSLLGLRSFTATARLILEIHRF